MDLTSYKGEGKDNQNNHYGMRKHRVNSRLNIVNLFLAGILGLVLLLFYQNQNLLEVISYNHSVDCPKECDQNNKTKLECPSFECPISNISKPHVYSPLILSKLKEKGS